jgi:hypothetical protein
MSLVPQIPPSRVTLVGGGLEVHLRSWADGFHPKKVLRRTDATIVRKQIVLRAPRDGLADGYLPPALPHRPWRLYSDLETEKPQGS